MSDELRAELASLLASLRAHLDWQESSGASGVPRLRADGGRALLPRHDIAATSASPAVPASSGSSDRTPPGLASDVVAPSGTGAVRLGQLAGEVASCTRCVLANTRTQTVFARGNPDARLCFVGEAPGADEDAQGAPFVGRAGQLLDRMIGAMGLSPANDVYICNIIKCRPPGNRRPLPEEIATCIPYLHEQIGLVSPRVIVALGNTAVGALLDTRLGITKLRGRWQRYGNGTPVMPTYHPSYLLRPSPQQNDAKRQAWEDLQLVMKELGLPLPKK